MSDTLGISGAEGLSVEEIKLQIDRGARLVIYQYCVSLIIITFRRNSELKFIPAGHSAAAAGWPYVLISFFLGWWGFPFGLIYTPAALFKNLRGGADVTSAWLAAIDEQPASE